MNIYPVDVSTKLFEEYYNKGKPNLFMVQVDVMFFGFKDQLDQIDGRISHRDTKRMNIVEYRLPLVDTDGSVWFT
ncbi:hypothetical protein MTR_4g101770 [Medicago truncatula]|uniref:Uncharacterized protein n=1 Tax=Medicago truncatula TaxID=3880 RepID=G7JK57_MEDTR|nr:hypothetical protein MTR_4g101770 [Medicago truncatula]